MISLVVIIALILGTQAITVLAVVYLLREVIHGIQNRAPDTHTEPTGATRGDWGNWA